MKNKNLETFLRDKLQSEIESFGDGNTEFHTRDLEQLIRILDEKDKLVNTMETELAYLKNKTTQLELVVHSKNMIIVGLDNNIVKLKFFAGEMAKATQQYIDADGSINQDRIIKATLNYIVNSDGKIH